MTQYVVVAMDDEAIPASLRPLLGQIFAEDDREPGLLPAVGVATCGNLDVVHSDAMHVCLVCMCCLILCL